MLRKAAGDVHDGLLRNFLRWEARLLARYGTDNGSVTFSELPRVWHRHFRHVLALLWFPALLIYLASPLPSPVMERIAAILSDKAPESNGMVASRRDASMQLIQEALLKGDLGDFYFQSPERFPDGWLTPGFPDFPRVYRKVEAICGGAIPGCSVAPGPYLPGGPRTVQPLRAGRARLDFSRTAASPLDLQLVLTLFQCDGKSVVSTGKVH